MKNTLKKFLACVLIVVMVFAFCTTAFAAVSNTKTWSSTTCKVSFTTSAYIKKDTLPLYGTGWDSFYVTPTYVEHSNGSVEKINITPKCTDGTTMGNKVCIWEGVKTTINSINYDDDKEKVKLLVGNPYSNGTNNMKSNGNWYGEYYAN